MVVYVCCNQTSTAAPHQIIVFFLWGSLPLEEFLFLPSEAKKLMLEKVKDENLMTKPMA